MAVVPLVRLPEPEHFIRQPYVYAVVPEFARPDLFDGICAEYPGDALTTSVPIHGGRRQIANDNLVFYRLLESRPFLETLYTYVNDPRFVGSLLRRFHIPEHPFDRHYYFRTASRRGTKEQQHVQNVRTTDLLRIVIERGVSRVSRRARKVTASFRPRRLSLYLGLSIAGPGYAREVHRDSDSRVLSMVWFLNDTQPGAGGEFVVHRLVNDTPLRRCPPQPKPEAVETSAVYIPRANTAVLFPSVPNAYHSVRLTTSTEWRRFVYASVTVLDDQRAWPNDHRFNF